MNKAWQLKSLVNVWPLFLLLFPFYFFSSGSPQISDVFFAGFFVAAITAGLKLNPEATRISQLLIAFLFHVALVNAVWSTLLAEPGMLVFVSYYAYNAAVFIVMLALHSAAPETFLRRTVQAVALSVVIQVILSPFTMRVAAVRHTLFFNNPNQLGYYGLLAAVIISVGARHLGWSRKSFIILHFGVFYLIALSLSKAAILGYLFLVAVLLAKKPLTLALFAAAVAAVLPFLTQTLDLVANLESRLSGLGLDADDSLAQRGYDRIWNHPGHWIFGAGEGEYSRFQSVLPGELHSSWGTLFFAYGAIGVALFAVFAVVIIRGLDLRSVALSIPVVFYGVTHQGLRFTLFWVLLGVLFCLSCERRRVGRTWSAPRAYPSSDLMRGKTASVGGAPA